MDARAAQVPLEYLAKARQADRDMSAGAPSNHSAMEPITEDYYLGMNATSMPTSQPGVPPHTLWGTLGHFSGACVNSGEWPKNHIKRW